MLTLIGKLVTLRPITASDVDALWEAGRDPRIWDLAYGPRNYDEMHEYVREAIEQQDAGRAFVFALTNCNCEIVGSTRIKEIDRTHKSCEVGNTWIVPRLWRSGINPESKLLVLEHAFEQMSMNRVAFHVGAQNVRSRLAMEGLGATQEAILRSRQLLPTGERRDWVVYSIVNDEWPEIKKRLQASLEAS